MWQQREKNEVYDLVEFSVTNPTSSDVQFDFFNTYDMPIVPTSPTGSLYVVGSSNYNQFVRQLPDMPKRIRRVIVIGESVSDLSNNLKIQYKDANGKQRSFSKLPNIKVSPYQYQGRYSMVDFKYGEFVLNGNMTIQNYVIPANKTISFIFFYKEIKKSNLLSGYMSLSVYNAQYDPNHRTEKQLQRQWCFNCDNLSFPIMRYEEIPNKGILLKDKEVMYNRLKRERDGGNKNKYSYQ